MKSLKEMDGDLINHWYILALENEVPAKAPIKRFLYETAYVLFRDEKGQVAVLKDQCIHRGAQLSLGSIENGQIRCPYHGWKFDGKGALTEIPSDGPEVAEKKTWCASHPPVVVQDGCVWIWPGEVNMAGNGPQWRFPRAGDRSVVQYFMITDFDNEVGHLIQNFMDVPHTVFVHSKWFRNRSLLKVPVQIEVGAGRVKVTYQQPNDSIGFSERVLNPSKEPMKHTDEFIFPNLSRVDYQFGEKFFIINSQCSPIERYKTRVYTWIAYDIGMLSFPLKKFIQFYTRKVIEQDVQIMKNQGDNLRRSEHHEFKSTQADELHIAIEQIRTLGIKGSAEAAQPSFNREREFWI